MDMLTFPLDEDDCAAGAVVAWAAVLPLVLPVVLLELVGALEEPTFGAPQAATTGATTAKRPIDARRRRRLTMG